MSILDFFRPKLRPDLDQSVLVQLRKAGSDLTKPHHIEFFLYFPTKPVADEAALTIRNAGFEDEVRNAAPGDHWLCFATKTMVPELSELQKIRRDFVSLAVSMNGEYDGWGTPVVK